MSGMAPRDCTSSCSHRSVSTSSPSVDVQRRDAARLPPSRSVSPCKPDGAEADAERPHLPVLARVDGRERQSGEDFLQEAVELVAAHFALELEALDSRRHQPAIPNPIP